RSGKGRWLQARQPAANRDGSRSDSLGEARLHLSRGPLIAQRAVPVGAIYHFVPPALPDVVGDSAADVWSWTIRQPADVRRNSKVNRPHGASCGRSSLQRPKANAASGARAVTS